MGDRIIAYTGKLLVHAVRALLVCWQRMLRLGLSVGVLSGIVALVFGTYVTHTFPPAPLTWVAALFFGLALGYAAAMTVLADEMLLSIFEAIRLLEGDVRAGMRAAAVAAEREAGEAGRGIMRFLGHSRSQSAETAPRSGKAPPSQPLMTVSSVERHGPGQDQANETLAAIAATESFINTAPRPAVNARPVRAADLPRIGWASDDAATRRAPEVIVAVAPALAEMPPLPVRSLRSQPRAAVVAADDASATVPTDGYVGTVGRVATWDDAVTQPTGEEAGDRLAETPAAQQDADAVTQHPTTNDAPIGVAAEETASGDAPAITETQEMAPSSDAAPATDRPPAATTRPIEPDREERGIWARIGQALIGNTTVPLRDTDMAVNPGSEPSEMGAP